MWRFKPLVGDCFRTRHSSTYAARLQVFALRTTKYESMLTLDDTYDGRAGIVKELRRVGSKPLVKTCKQRLQISEAKRYPTGRGGMHRPAPETPAGITGFRASISTAWRD